MTEENNQLLESVRRIEINGKEIYLLGTAHVSKESVEDVRKTIETVKPDSVCIELCRGRYKALTQRNNWKNMNIFKIIREKKAAFLLAQLIMTSFYRKLGEKLGVLPGAEMLEAGKQAKKIGAELIPADRNIEITIKRVWRYLGFLDKIKLFAEILLGLFEKEEINEKTIETIKKQDQLESIMAEFAEKFPEIKRRLLDERDIYLSQKIRKSPGRKIVAVAGAGHIKGIIENISREQSLEPLTQIPPKSIIPKVLKWAIPILILAILAVGFFKGELEHSLQSIYIWFLLNGTLAALGSAIALGHPLTILASFAAAPLTSLLMFE